MREMNPLMVCNVQTWEWKSGKKGMIAHAVIFIGSRMPTAS